MAEQLKPLEQIISELRQEQGSATPVIQKIALPNFKQDVGKIQDIQYDVPTNAIFDRLSDGTYIPRFENYAGAVGNEDRLAQDQSWYEQAGYGLVKNARKLGNYFLDATVGTVAGVVNAISTGSLEGFYENDFSTMIDDWNKQLDYKLPNYYTDEQKSQNFLQSLGSANFWFNDVAGGLAFVGGALLPELVLGAVTGGATLPASFAKLGLKATGKQLLKIAGREVAEEALDPTNYINGAKTLNAVNDLHTLEKGVDLVKGYQRAQYLKKAGDVINTGLFLARTSGFEAGMEARQNYKDAMSQYFETFEDKNGRQPTFEEIQNFSETARVAANGVFGANMAILAVSNAAMFGKVFNVKLPALSKSFTNLGNRVIGLGVKSLDDATLAVQKANRVQKIAGSTYKLLGKASVEGLYEEGLQGVAGQTMQNYLNAQYDPKSDSSYGLWASFTDAFAHQYGSKEGWKEIGLGMMIGFLGSPITGNGWEGLGRNSRRAAAERVSQDVESANTGVQVLRNMNRAASIQNFRNIVESKNETYESTAAENALMNLQFIRSQEHLKSESQIQRDFDTVIDHMELDEQQISLIGSENVDTYKQSLKEEFRKNISDFNFAKNTVDALGIGQKIKEDAGNIEEIKNALTVNIYMGKNALSSAQNIAEQIQTITGQQGVFDYMEFYNGLSSQKKKDVETLRKKQRRLQKLEDLAVEYGQRAAGVQVEGRREFRQPTLEKRYTQNAEKLVLTQQEIIKLQNEISQAEQALATDFRSVSLNLDGTLSTFRDSLNVLDVVNELDKIDLYKESLRANGKDYEADSLEYLTTQFKIYSDAHRQMLDTARRMTATDYFASTSGRKLISTIIGDKYKMSEETIKALRDNEALVDASLRQAGLTGYETAAQRVQEVIEKNPNISEREKFRLESIVRLNLGMQALQERLSDISTAKITYNSEPLKSTSPLEGDTIVIRQRLDISQDGINNLTLLNETIDQILSQIEYLRDDSAGVSNLQNLQTQLEGLETRRAEILQNTIEPEYEEADYDKVQQLANELKSGNYATTESQTQNEEGQAKSDLEQYSGISSQGQEETLQETDNRDSNSSRNTEEEKLENLQLATNYPKLLEILVAGGTNPVQDLDNEIESVQNKIDSLKSRFRIIDSPEYLRLNELMVKKEKGELSDNEGLELSELEDDVNQWLLITGTVADGLRLSDLIRQKVVLEQTPVAEIENVDQITAQEVLEGVDLGERQGAANYLNGQTYDSVTAIRDDQTGLISISGIKVDSLFQEVGFPFEYTLNERGNILISDEVRNVINTQSPISILPTNQDLSTNYSVVIRHGGGINGDIQSGPLKSDYSEDFTELQNPQALYDLTDGQQLVLEIDPQDDYNKDLLDAYKNTLTEGAMSDEQLEELEETIHTQLINNDATIKELEKQVTKLRLEAGNSETTIDRKSKLNKEIQATDTKISKREDVLYKQAQKEAKQRSNRTATTEEKQEALENLKRGLVIRIKDQSNNFLAVMKGKNSSIIKTPMDERFESLRNQIVNDSELLERLANVPVADQLEISPKVKKVYLGHPNFNFIKNEDGSVGIEYRQVNSENSKKIIDLGFVENGKIRTRSKSEDRLNTTFLSKFIRRDAEAKIPFVVFMQGNKRVAYPVRLLEQDRPTTEEFSKIFNSSASINNKVAALNRFMASRGIDIKQPGNAFYAVGATNLTPEFFQQKLDQLNAINYFSDLQSWLDPSSNVQEIVQREVLINIDLTSPLHSPKLQMDISELDIKTTVQPESKQKKNKNKKEVMSQSVLLSLAARDAVINADQELNEDC